MSRTKGVVIDGQLRWVWSDAHDIALALMADVAETMPNVPQEWLVDWRTCAGISDLAFNTAEAPTDAQRQLIQDVLNRARHLAHERGDTSKDQVRDWHLGNGLLVCEGSLYTDPVRREQVLEVIDTYMELLDRKTEQDQLALVGAPAGQS